MKSAKVKAILSILAVFALIFVFDWLWHAVLMADIYASTASLWRTQAEMAATFPIMMLGQLIMATLFYVLFSFGYQDRGILEGVRFGIYLTTFSIGPLFIMYSVAPYTPIMVALWIIGKYIEFILAGMILSLLYQPLDE